MITNIHTHIQTHIKFAICSVCINESESKTFQEMNLIIVER